MAFNVLVSKTSLYSREQLKLLFARQHTAEIRESLTAKIEQSPSNPTTLAVIFIPNHKRRAFITTVVVASLWHIVLNGFYTTTTNNTNNTNRFIPHKYT